MQLSFSQDRNRLYILYFIIAWFLLNLIQGFFTQLSHDESYYWMFSQHLDWGYYDHPPMVALLIKIGYTLIPNEGGVRLFINILSTSSVFIIFKMLNKGKDDALLFAAIAFSVCMFNASGFLAVPDVPLIFFTALFFYCYQQYLKSPSYVSELLLALSIALLLYSKYHGVLVIFFVILSNPKLLRTFSLYRIAIISVLLYLPHIYWQIIHDYPSVKYHLIYRSKDPYRLQFTLDYLFGQVLVTGPLIGLIILFAGFTYKTKDLFERSLKYTLIGIFVFFFFSSFKGWVEANWTIPAFIPLIILAHQKISGSPLRKWVLYLSVPSVVLILATRMLLVTNILPDFGIKTQFHNWDKWAKQIEEKAGDRPVIFHSSYQLASKYSFYAKKTGHSHNAFSYRRNMYDIWNIENNIQGKSAMFYSGYPLYNSDTLPTIHNEHVFINLLDDYRSYNKIDVALSNDQYLQASSDSLEFEITISNNFDKAVDFNANPDLPVSLHAFIHENNHMVLNGGSLKLTEKIQPKMSLNKKIKIAVPQKPGKYDIKFGITAGYLPAGFNSQLIKLLIIPNEH